RPASRARRRCSGWAAPVRSTCTGPRAPRGTRSTPAPPPRAPGSTPGRPARPRTAPSAPGIAGRASGPRRPGTTSRCSASRRRAPTPARAPAPPRVRRAARPRTPPRPTGRRRPSRSPRGRAPARSQPDRDRLLVGEREQLVEALLAAHAGLLAPAERRAEVVRPGVVDPDVAGLDPRGRAQRGGDVPRPDRGREPVLHGVDVREHRPLVAPAEQRDDRPEDLLPGDRHRLRDVREDGRLQEEAARELG